MSEYGDAIASLVAAVRDVDKAAARSDKIRSERDDALARLAAVRVACDGATSEGQGFIAVSALRAAAGLTGGTP